MSKPITKEQFFDEASKQCTPARLKALRSLLSFSEASTALQLQFTRAKTHHTVSASIRRRDGGRTTVFASYANGRMWCQYFTSLPDWVTEDQEKRISDAQERYRVATGGDAGKHWQYFNTDELPLIDVENAINNVSESIGKELM